MSGSGGNTSGIYNLSSVMVSTGTNPSAAKVFSFPLTLTGATLTIDLTPLANLHRIDNVQGLFIDNSAGTQSLNVNTTAGQNFTIPSTYQGLMPLYLSAQNIINFTGNGTVNITLLNFPTPAAVWPTTLPSGATQQVQDVVAEGYLAQMIPGASPTSASTTTPGTPASTQLWANNPARKYVMVQSPYLSGTFYDLWINPLGGTAGVGSTDCFRIAAGGLYESASFVSQSAWNYYCATGGAALMAMQG